MGRGLRLDLRCVAGSVGRAAIRGRGSTLNGGMLQVTILALELASPTLPPGKTLAMNLQDPSAIADMKRNPVTIKEGVEFK